MEVSALFVVSRSLGLRTAWAGVVSDRILGGDHEGSVGAGEVPQVATTSALEILRHWI